MDWNCINGNYGWVKCQKIIYHFAFTTNIIVTADSLMANNNSTLILLSFVTPLRFGYFFFKLFFMFRVAPLFRSFPFDIIFFFFFPQRNFYNAFFYTSWQLFLFFVQCFISYFSSTAISFFSIEKLRLVSIVSHCNHFRSFHFTSFQSLLPFSFSLGTFARVESFVRVFPPIL